MWRGVLLAEELTKTLKRGILSAIEVSPWDLMRLFCWMLASVVAYALILRVLEEVLRLT
jgi:hypothetical protein